MEMRHFLHGILSGIGDRPEPGTACAGLNPNISQTRPKVRVKSTISSSEASRQKWSWVT
jgi:hypothetical protein